MKKLYRSKHNRKISGICGGLGVYFNVDPTVIRLTMIFLCLITGIAPLLLAYIIGWIIIPEAPSNQENQNKHI